MKFTKAVARTLICTICISGAGALLDGFPAPPGSGPAFAATRENSQRGDDRQQERARSADRRPDREDHGRRDGRGRSGGGFFKRGGRSWGTPTDEQWRSVEDFMKEYSPYRWQVFQQVLKSRRADRAKRFLFARYMELNELAERDEDEHARQLDKLRLEDDIFHFADLIGSAAPDEVADLQKKLDEAVRKLVEQDLEEREQRVRWLQEQLSKQSNALARDRDNIDEVVKKRAGNALDAAEGFQAWADRAANEDAEHQKSDR